MSRVRRSYRGKFVVDEQSKNVVGINFGGDYCAEHEQPAIQLLWAFGVDSNKLGVERLQATKFPQPLVKTGTVNRKPAMLLYFSVRKMGRYQQAIQDGANCRKIAGELGLLGWSPDEDLSIGWDSESFGILARGEKNIANLQSVLQMWDDKDICILQCQSGPFGSSGLIFVRACAFSEDEKKNMLERDMDALNLKKAAEKTGIVKKLKKAGLQWHALEPQWRDFFKDPVYHSKYKVIFFLNPHEQKKYNAGWFTVEELLQWIKGKGPVMKG